MPVHSVQAPYGLLNENERGSTSNEASGWSLGHAIFSLNRRSRSGEPSGSSTRSTVRMPPASPSAVSTLSVRRRLLDGFATSRSTTTSIVCLSFFSSTGGSAQRHHLAVDPGPREALALQLAEQVGVLPLAAPDDRREHLEAGALGQLEQPVDDLLRGLPRDRLAAHRAVRAAGAGPEQAQVVVDLGDRADGRARVAVRRLLVDRDRRRQALDEVDVGLVHLAEELPGVRRQRLDVPALALGEDRVERQGRLARAGQAGEDDQGVPRAARARRPSGCAHGHRGRSVGRSQVLLEGSGRARGQRPHARWRVRQTLPGRGKRPTAGCRGCQRRAWAAACPPRYSGVPWRAEDELGGPLWRTRVR